MFDSTTFTLDTSTIVISYIVSIICGVILTIVYSYKNRYSKNMLLTLIALPVIVQSLILVINGNVGTSVAVLGTFSLVRFRSAQGNAKDITFVFLAMTIGICSAVGLWVYSLLVTLLIGIIAIALKLIPIGEQQKNLSRHLKISVPDDISFKEEFKPVFEKYTKKCDVLNIKTSQLGSIYTIEYNIIMKENGMEKELIDELRVKNSNLPIVCNSMITDIDNNDRAL